MKLLKFIIVILFSGIYLQSHSQYSTTYKQPNYGSLKDPSLSSTGLANQYSFDKEIDLNYHSYDSIVRTPKRPLWSIGEVIGINLFVWSFDKFILDADFAQISLNSMETNLKKGFYWDNDNFMTNHFNHPYHGSLYYNAGRSNGMNYWYSGLHALGGSLMWELLMEVEYPSLNDLIATSVGGSALGEIFYRASDLVIDERTRGSERIWREIGGFILSPSRGLTRVMTGEAWKKSRYSGKQLSYPEDLSIHLATGLKAIQLNDFDKNPISHGLGGTLDVLVRYGDIFKEDISPYDYFFFYGSVNAIKGQPIIGRINIVGGLWTTNVYEKGNHDINIGAFQYFDYYDSDELKRKDEGSREDVRQIPYKVGSPASFGLGALYRGTNNSKSLKFYAQAHLNGILLGSSLSDYYLGDQRLYNWGSGFGVKSNLALQYKKLEWTLQSDGFYIYTWKGYPEGAHLGEDLDYKEMNVQGDKSDAYYNIVGTRLSYNFNSKWSLSGHWNHMFRHTKYKFYPDVKSETSEFKLMVAYKIL